MKLATQILASCFSVWMFLGSMMGLNILDWGLQKEPSMPVATFLRDWFWPIQFACLLLSGTLLTRSKRTAWICWCCTQFVIWQLAISAVWMQRLQKEAPVFINGSKATESR